MSKISLQEAFLRKKIDFVQQSQERLRKLKLSAERRERAVLEAGRAKGRTRTGTAKRANASPSKTGGGGGAGGGAVPHSRLPSSDVASRRHDREDTGKMRTLAVLLTHTAFFSVTVTLQVCLWTSCFPLPGTERESRRQR